MTDWIFFSLEVCLKVRCFLLCFYQSKNILHKCSLLKLIIYKQDLGCICDTIFWFKAVINRRYSWNGIFFSIRSSCVFDFWTDQFGLSWIESVETLTWNFHLLRFWFPWFYSLHYFPKTQHPVCKIR